VLPVEDRAPSLQEAEEATGYEQPRLELGMLPAPRALPVSRLSYSGLEAYRKCGYRFYLQRALGLGRVEPPPAAPSDAPAPDGGITALLRGTVVHGLLERLDFANPVVPSDSDVAAAIEFHGIEALPEEVADVRDMVERLAGSALRDRIAAARRVRTELPFAFTLDVGNRSLLINGVVDIHADEGAQTLVVDWKSDALGELDPETLTAQSYSTQRLVYALAALKAGAERVEVVHCYLERPDEPAVAQYEAADLEELERQLLALARGVVDGRFEPSSEPHFALCADCPGRAALCVHPEELTTRLSVHAPS
jgi:ATP-dependent helicase/nuclease subunit A